MKRNWKLKYAIEWTISLFISIILFPLLLLICILELIPKFGAIFYISERIGKNGKLFNLYKFRGMRENSTPLITKELKYITLKDDPRITYLGKYLRIGFDELGQLINILKGDMCIIGPRPNLPFELGLYNEREIKRLLVLPGITGLAQVLDGRQLHYKQNYELDVLYIEFSSFSLDLKIILCTFFYMVGLKRLNMIILKRFLINIQNSKV
jgi:lipopolysaccharide/colanic/teichoic acid biosynthesis glycosyltransferase